MARSVCGVDRSFARAGNDPFSGNTELVITLTDVVSGDKTWEIIRQASMFNDEPGEGKEYIIACFAVEVVSLERAPFDLNHLMFEAVSAVGVVYSDFVVVVSLEPELAAELYEGATHRGWTYFLVREDDSPMAVFNRGRYGANAWFALRRSKD